MCTDVPPARAMTMDAVPRCMLYIGYQGDALQILYEESHRRDLGHRISFPARHVVSKRPASSPPPNGRRDGRHYTYHQLPASGKHHTATVWRIKEL